LTERPVIFRGDMVRAILELRKTVTRRVLTRMGCTVSGYRAKKEYWNEMRFEGAWADPGLGAGAYLKVPHKLDGWDETVQRVRPYIDEGDVLWVRETWAPMCREADPICWCETDEQRAANHYFEYRADTGNKRPGDWPEEETGDCVPKWRSSMLMPKKACRLKVRVLERRPERLQEITTEEIRAEGIDLTDIEGERVFATLDELARARWINLWNDTNAKRGYPWEKNPWVWRYRFELYNDDGERAE